MSDLHDKYKRLLAAGMPEVEGVYWSVQWHLNGYGVGPWDCEITDKHVEWLIQGAAEEYFKPTVMRWHGVLSVYMVVDGDIVSTSGRDSVLESVDALLAGRGVQRPELQAAGFFALECAYTEHDIKIKQTDSGRWVKA